jgi:hypothetical protein
VKGRLIEEGHGGRGCRPARSSVPLIVGGAAAGPSGRTVRSEEAGRCPVVVQDSQASDRNR